MLMVVPLVAALLAGGRVSSASSDDELAFGIEVARKGLWNEARFRFERQILANGIKKICGRGRLAPAGNRIDHAQNRERSKYRRSDCRSPRYRD